MKQIGKTAAGSVIVEMTVHEYEALEALQQPQGGGPPSQSEGAVAPEIAPRMNHSGRSAYVAERLKKLGPKKKDGAIRAIETMFQFSGGIESTEVEKLLSTLQEQRILSIARDGKVTYPGV